MTVDELVQKLEFISMDGMGGMDVVIPCQTGGSVSVTDVEAEDDDFIVRLS